MTREIILSKGEVALVDDEDYEFLNQWKWYCNVHGNLKYAVRKVNNGDNTWTRYLMHRVIIECPKDLYTDHINGNGLDNRRCNLRQATKRENTLNRKPRSTNASGKTGVKKSTWKGRWEAYIRVHGKYIHLGSFVEKDEAIQARISAEKVYFGEFARQESV